MPNSPWSRVTREDSLALALAPVKWKAFSEQPRWETYQTPVHDQQCYPTNFALALLTSSKELDFEARSVHTLLVAVTNEEPFSSPVSTSTATVIVDVLDVNEPPVFKQAVISASVSEDADVGSSVAVLKAEDPDKARKQSIRLGLMTTHRQLGYVCNTLLQH